jgi:hypothetical protein
MGCGLTGLALLAGNVVKTWNFFLATTFERQTAAKSALKPLCVPGMGALTYRNVSQ